MEEQYFRIFLLLLGILQFFSSFFSWKTVNTKFKDVWKKSLIPGIIAVFCAWKIDLLIGCVFSGIVSAIFMGIFYFSLDSEERNLKKWSKFFISNIALTLLYFVVGYVGSSAQHAVNDSRTENKKRTTRTFKEIYKNKIRDAKTQENIIKITQDYKNALQAQQEYKNVGNFPK